MSRTVVYVLRRWSLIAHATQWPPSGWRTGCLRGAR
jgi:hypothetical protein